MRNLLILLIILIIGVSAYSQQRGQFQALLYTKTNGFHHVSIHEGVTAVRQLADRHFFQVDWQESPGVFNDERLERYDVIIFLNTTGDILNDVQQMAMEKFIQSGKGFVGIHSASDTEYEWEWYTKLVGRMFKIHPVIQTAILNVHERNFPGMEKIPDNWLWTDEWYEFQDATIEGLNTLISVDENTYEVEVQWGEKVGEGMGSNSGDHPISWYHEYDGGRSFYTALGHVESTYSDPAFLQHLYGGIYWAATGKGIR